MSGAGSRRSPRIHTVIIAGGAGTRFWPLSREAHPKPLLRAGGRQTLLEETVARARRLSAPDDIWLVCGREHARVMRAASGIPRRRTIEEPRMRNTAAAIGHAALRLQAVDPDAVMVVLSADHRIPDGKAFATSLRRAAKAAADTGSLVTIGVAPTRPEPGYGYIRLGPAVGRKHAGLHRVGRFVEKPDVARARRFLKKGGYFWNAGIFAWTAASILEELSVCAPEVFRALAPIAKALRERRGREAAVARSYRRLPSAPIDKAVLERSGRVWCLPVRFHWSDVGTWQSLAQELGVGPSVTKVIDGEALLCDAWGNLVRGADRPIVLMGVEGLAVIDSGDAILVADLERSGEVRQVVDQLRRRGRRDLL